MPSSPTVSLISLGCARNDVDSSEIAGRLAAGGYRLLEDATTDEPAEKADIVVVNTCAFVASAKKDSIDTILAAADTGSKVVAVGCLAERYGAELAAELPEADAVLGFDSYPELASLLGDVLDGHKPASHTPVDRRTLLPITPVARQAAAASISVPGHAAPSGTAAGPVLTRRLLHSGPVAPLKIASGCDRRCTFCAIPSFRGSFVSRSHDEIVAEAGWLAGQGVGELVLVSENSTSYGKDLPGDRLLENLLVELAAVPGVRRVRASYLQPAETKPSLLQTIARTAGVADYFDMSFQHASEPVLRRMRRFGSVASFLALVDSMRALAPEAGIRSNVIVGFPGETNDDLEALRAFLVGARMDAVGVFGYSDEDGTAALELDGKIDEDEIAARVESITSLAEAIAAQRAEDRVGTEIVVLVDDPEGGVDDYGTDSVVGRAEHQGPEVDGSTTIVGADGIALGELVRCRVVDSWGIDLVAEPLEVLPGGSTGR